MSDLRELYQEVILDHYKRPRNFRVIGNAPRKADGHNPLCGDRVTVYVAVEDGLVKDVSFQGSGCAISTASASMMTDHLRGKTVEEAERVFRAFHEMLTAQPGETRPDESLGKLAVFAGVCEFPMRVKCATLAWHTLHAALERGDGSVTTE